MFANAPQDDLRDICGKPSPPFLDEDKETLNDCGESTSHCNENSFAADLYDDPLSDKTLYDDPATVKEILLPSPQASVSNGHFMRLAMELRLVTYAFVIEDPLECQHCNEHGNVTQHRLKDFFSLSMVSRQIYLEMKRLFFDRMVVTLPYIPSSKKDSFLLPVHGKWEGGLAARNFFQAHVLKLSLQLCPGWFLTGTSVSPIPMLEFLMKNGHLQDLEVQIIKPEAFIPDYWGQAEDYLGIDGLTSVPLMVFMSEFWWLLEILTSSKLHSVKLTAHVGDRDIFWKAFKKRNDVDESEGSPPNFVEVDIDRLTRLGHFGSPGKLDWHPWSKHYSQQEEGNLKREIDTQWIKECCRVAYGAEKYEDLTDLLCDHGNGLSWTAT